MAIRKPISLTVTHHFDQAPERVFDAWLDAETARHWLFAAEAGEMVRAEIEPQIGGTFLFVVRLGGRDIEHTGIYLDIERPRRLSFTFVVPQFSSAEASVVVEIAPAGSGGADLTLSQEMGVEQMEWRASTEEGWRTILANLARQLDGEADERD